MSNSIKSHTPEQKEPQSRNIRVIKNIVFNEQGEVLILRKFAENWNEVTGPFDLPGGKTDPSDKSFLHTLTRETQEEIGLLVKPLSLYAVNYEKYKNSAKNRILDIATYVTEVIGKPEVILRGREGNEPEAEKEHESHHWMKPAHLARIAKLNKQLEQGIQIDPRREEIGCPKHQDPLEYLQFWRGSQWLIPIVERAIKKRKNALVSKRTVFSKFKFPSRNKKNIKDHELQWPNVIMRTGYRLQEVITKE